MKKQKFVLFLLPLIFSLILISAADTNKDNKNSNLFDEIWKAINELIVKVNNLFGITSDLQNQITNISLTPGPSGDKGDTGEQGLTGAQGIQGVQGEKGEKGDIGSAGPTKALQTTYVKGEETLEILPVWAVGHQPSVYYRFNESSGDAMDSSGNGLTWFINTDWGSYVDGKLNNAGFASGGGTNAFERAGGSQFEFGTGDFTVAFWFKRGSTTKGDTILGTMNGKDVIWDTLIVGDNMAWINANGPLVAKLQLQGTSYICDDNWHRVVFVRRGLGTDEFSLWVDGVNEANGTNADNIIGSTLFRWYSHVSTLFDTGIDDFAIYNDYAFTEQQIIDDWNNGNGREQQIDGEKYKNKACCSEGWVRTGCNGVKINFIQPTDPQCCENSETGIPETGSSEVWAICLKYAD